MHQTRIWSWVQCSQLLEIPKKYFVFYNKHCLMCSESKAMTQKYKTVKSLSWPELYLCEDASGGRVLASPLQGVLPPATTCLCVCSSQHFGISSTSPLSVWLLSICFIWYSCCLPYSVILHTVKGELNERHMILKNSHLKFCTLEKKNKKTKKQKKCNHSLRSEIKPANLLAFLLFLGSWPE